VILSRPPLGHFTRGQERPRRRTRSAFAFGYPAVAHLPPATARARAPSEISTFLPRPALPVLLRRVVALHAGSSSVRGRGVGGGRAAEVDRAESWRQLTGQKCRRSLRNRQRAESVSCFARPIERDTSASLRSGLTVSGLQHLLHFFFSCLFLLSDVYISVCTTT